MIRRGRKGATRGVSLALVTVTLACLWLGWLPKGSVAAVPLAQECIAAGTVEPVEVLGGTFNHHPERNREARPTDKSYKPFQIESGAAVVLPRLPPQCGERYSQLFQARLQFKSTTSGGHWRSMGEWRAPTPHDRAYDGSTQSASYYDEVSTGGLVRGLREGCALASRLQLDTSILETATGAIIARTKAAFAIPVDSWYEARCMGKVSIHDLQDLRPCGTRARGGGPGSLNIISWSERAKGVNCAGAAEVAQAALEAPEFSEGLTAARVGGWQCYYPRRGGIVDCNQGDKRVYLVGRHSYGERCKAKSAVLTRVTVLGASCDAADGVIAAVTAEPRTALRVSSDLAGVRWSCAADRALGDDDRMTNTYHCFAGGEQIFFALADSPERIAPLVPVKIPPRVQLPPAGTISFPRAPDIKFFYEPTYGNHKITIPLQAESALFGQPAVVRIKIFAADCTNVKDGEGKVCGSRKSAGQVVRHVVLSANTDVAIDVPPNGDWVYLFTARTSPFVSAGVPFTAGFARRGASYFN